MSDNQSPQSNEQSNNKIRSRRRFIVGSAITPILMGLASRPVLGAQNCAPSGFMSGNLSHPDANGSCGGYSPGYWKNHYDWPAPFYSGTCELNNQGKPKCSKGVNSDGTLFSEAFPGTDHGGKTMLQVLWEQPGSLAFHAIACMLNAASNLPDYILTEAEVRQIYTEWYLYGYYTTSNGIQMYESDIRAFFQNTYH